MRRSLLLPLSLAMLAAACQPPSPTPPAPAGLTMRDVLNGLNKCEAFEMGTAEPQLHFNKSTATGNDMCSLKQQQSGKTQICALAGRIYAVPVPQETGYGVWSCARDVVGAGHNGWALCCPV